MQQLFAVWNVQRWGYFAYMGLSILCTIPLAAASWWAVERNALKFRKTDPRTVKRWMLGQPAVPETTKVS